MAFAQEFIEACSVKEFRDLFQKLVVNAIRQESREGGAVHTLVSEQLGNQYGAGGAFYEGEGPYSRINETNFLNLAKLVTGKENPTGYNAKTLHEAFVALLAEAVAEAQGDGEAGDAGGAQ